MSDCQHCDNIQQLHDELNSLRRVVSGHPPQHIELMEQIADQARHVVAWHGQIGNQTWDINIVVGALRALLGRLDACYCDGDSHGHPFTPGQCPAIDGKPVGRLRV